MSRVARDVTPRSKRRKNNWGIDVAVCVPFRAALEGDIRLFLFLFGSFIK
jgi:hypothetical protein